MTRARTAVDLRWWVLLEKRLDSVPIPNVNERLDRTFKRGRTAYIHEKNSIQNTRQYIIVCKRHERYVLSKIVVDFKGYIQTIRYFALLIYKRLSAFPFQNIFYSNHVFYPKLFIILPIKQLINKSNFEHSERRYV